MVYRYYPAISWRGYMMCGRDRNYRFWYDSEIFRYSYIMVSYGSFYADALEEGTTPSSLAEAMMVGEAEDVFVDSGGFQLVLGRVRIDPAEAYRFELRWGNRVLPLDYPPMTERDGLRARSVYGKSIEITKKNMELLLKVAGEREVENKKIYAILHGVSLSDYLLWEKNVFNDLLPSFDGVAFATRPTRAWQSSMLAKMFALSRGYKNVHFLGVSSFSTLPPLIYRSGNGFWSSDTVTWDKTSGFANIVAPGLFGTVRGGRKGGKDVDLSILPCHCPACQWLRMNRPDSHPFGMNDIVERITLALHNLFWRIAYIDMLVWMDVYGGMHDYVLDRFGYRLDPVDCVAEGGDIEACYYSYPDLYRYLDDLSLSRITTRRVRSGWW